MLGCPCRTHCIVSPCGELFSYRSTMVTRNHACCNLQTVVHVCVCVYVYIRSICMYTSQIYIYIYIHTYYIDIYIHARHKQKQSAWVMLRNNLRSDMWHVDTTSKLRFLNAVQVLSFICFISPVQDPKERSVPVCLGQRNWEESQ